MGAPTGTFPGGLPLEDRNASALEKTGLLYHCSLVDRDPLCGPVLGDDDIALADDDNDGLHGAGRLFDQRRTSYSTHFTSKVSHIPLP